MIKKIVDYLDTPERVRIIKGLFLASLVLLVVLDLFVDKHPYFEWAGFTGFSALCGFASCALSVLVSKSLGKLWLQKKEDHYD